MLIFKELYLKILFSILIVIASMLILQVLLNNLKLRALAAEVTASKLQITASSIEDTIIRAEGAGLALEEIKGLQKLIDRERKSDPSLHQILLVSPLGSTIISTGAKTIDDGDREAVLRRVLSSGEKVTLIDLGDLLYTGRVVFDSSSGIMGAIIISIPTDAFVIKTNAAWKLMAKGYIIIGLIITLFLIPIIFFQFSSIRKTFSILNMALFTNKTRKLGENNLQEVASTAVKGDLADLIVAGREKLVLAEEELEQINLDLTEAQNAKQ